MKDEKVFLPEAYSIRGEFVKSEFAMEVAPEYGSEPSFFIEAKLPNIQGGVISFESFEQMEEFSRHLARYVEQCRRQREFE